MHKSLEKHQNRTGEYSWFNGEVSRQKRVLRNRLFNLERTYKLTEKECFYDIINNGEALNSFVEDVEVGFAQRPDGMKLYTTISYKGLFAHYYDATDSHTGYAVIVRMPPVIQLFNPGSIQLLPVTLLNKDIMKEIENILVAFDKDNETDGALWDSWVKVKDKETMVQSPHRYSISLGVCTGAPTFSDFLFISRNITSESKFKCAFRSFLGQQVRGLTHWNLLDTLGGIYKPVLSFDDKSNPSPCWLGQNKVPETLRPFPRMDRDGFYKLTKEEMNQVIKENDDDIFADLSDTSCPLLFDNYIKNAK